MYCLKWQNRKHFVKPVIRLINHKYDCATVTTTIILLLWSLLLLANSFALALSLSLCLSFHFFSPLLSWSREYYYVSYCIVNAFDYGNSLWFPFIVSLYGAHSYEYFGCASLCVCVSRWASIVFIQFRPSRKHVVPVYIQWFKAQ